MFMSMYKIVEIIQCLLIRNLKSIANILIQQYSVIEFETFEN